MTEREERIAVIRERHGAATKGEWKARSAVGLGHDWAIDGPEDAWYSRWGQFNRQEDAEFIVHAHNEDIPWLLGELAREYTLVPCVVCGHGVRYAILGMCVACATKEMIWLQMEYADAREEKMECEKKLKGLQLFAL